MQQVAPVRRRGLLSSGQARLAPATRLASLPFHRATRLPGWKPDQLVDQLVEQPAQSCDPASQSGGFRQFRRFAATGIDPGHGSVSSGLQVDDTSLRAGRHPGVDLPQSVRCEACGSSAGENGLERNASRGSHAARPAGATIPRGIREDYGVWTCQGCGAPSGRGKVGKRGWSNRKRHCTLRPGCRAAQPVRQVSCVGRAAAQAAEYEQP